MNNNQVRIRKGVIILVRNTSMSKNRYLLVKQRNGSWSLPSGGTEEGETSIEAAIRELYEETGIKDVQLTKTNVINKFFYDELTQGVQDGFVCEYNNEEIPGTIEEDEIHETKWVTEEEAKNFLLKENQYKVFLELVQY